MSWRIDDLLYIASGETATYWMVFGLGDDLGTLLATPSEFDGTVLYTTQGVEARFDPSEQKTLRRMRYWVTVRNAGGQGVYFNLIGGGVT